MTLKRKTPGCQLSVCVTMCSSKDCPIPTELLRIFSGAPAFLVSIAVGGLVMTVLIWLIFEACELVDFETLVAIDIN